MDTPTRVADIRKKLKPTEFLLDLSWLFITLLLLIKEVDRLI